MSLAPDSQFQYFVNIDDLLSLSQDVRFNWPEARPVASQQRRQRFRESVETFAKLLYAIDVEKLNDTQYEAIERATRQVTHIVELHMMFDCDTSECQLFSSVSHRLRDAIGGLERGLPIDPAKRPSQDELFEKLDADFGRLGIC